MSTESWHLSKSVPVSLIFVMLLQAGGALWFFSKLQSDVFINSMRVEDIEERSKVNELNGQGAAIKISVIKNTLESMDKALRRIENKLE